MNLYMAWLIRFINFQAYLQASKEALRRAFVLCFLLSNLLKKKKNLFSFLLILYFRMGTVVRMEPLERLRRKSL